MKWGTLEVVSFLSLEAFKSKLEGTRDASSDTEKIQLPEGE